MLRPALLNYCRRIANGNFPLLPIKMSLSTTGRGSKFKIYTRTGDKGQTSLATGKRVSKNDPTITALGDNDELSSSIGLALEFCRQHEKLATLVEQLLYVQMRIQEINSSIATPNNDDNVNKDFDSTGSFTKQLEEWIDEMHDDLPLLKNFILPSGGLASAHLHVARAICRRTERSLHLLGHAPFSAKFLNRLSDYLFTAARFSCQVTDNKETIYKASA